ncbi:hypothetical protein WDL1CHR_03350 [Variovorax sp. WDL1]|nr:hypothetical protein CHC07_00521 [Variovorax sp. B4]PNG61414.1 hypothetical protein CHC06_01315 [Variovorax sp. B2]VTV12580.1 hypothetical protein WDL1CHR_03350 [Variovorax sp. WDL1]
MTLDVMKELTAGGYVGQREDLLGAGGRQSKLLRPFPTTRHPAR